MGTTLHLLNTSLEIIKNPDRRLDIACSSQDINAVDKWIDTASVQKVEQIIESLKSSKRSPFFSVRQLAYFDVLGGVTYLKDNVNVSTVSSIMLRVVRKHKDELSVSALQNMRKLLLALSSTEESKQAMSLIQEALKGKENSVRHHAMGFFEKASRFRR